MIFHVSVLKRGKSGPGLVQVGEVMADEFETWTLNEGTTYDFFVVEDHWFRKPTRTLVAHYPVGEWVVERA